jgi:hypothetical protein
MTTKIKTKKRTVLDIENEISKLYKEKEMLRDNEKKKEEAEKNKNKISLDKLKNYGAIDICNVWGIFPFIEKYHEVPEKFVLNNEEYFKFEEREQIKSIGFGDDERTIISKTKISRDYLNKAIKIANLLGHNEDSLSFYIQKNKQGEVIEDKAIILVIGNICFMFAPRVENEK